MKYKVVVACSAACVAAAISANAAVFTIGSTLGYAGIGITVGGPVTALTLAAVAVNQGATLDLAPVGTPVFVTPVLDSTLPAPTPGLPLTIWTEGPYSFSATSALVISGPNGGTYALNTTGLVDDGPGGLAATPATFTLAITPAVGPLGFYSAITTVVPEPSTYALLAGLGLVGFAGYRRFRS